ncbi:hypothetical protein LCGC14_1194540 [marine sediment metagenome]|uniref:Uncharacterized protein n=1 Tax=marine sediment metagenome TaxID=412755 RepID=A0A0F9LN74_9ZZZZ
MKIDEFIRLCMYRGITISDTNGHSWPIHDWQRFAKLTSFIDYGCNFKRGKCRNNGDDRLRSNGMGCCGGCDRHVGYLRSIPVDWKHLIKMARLFNKKTGFWRKGKGCALPSELRSSICLDYTCSGYNWALGVRSHQKPKLSRPAKRLLKLLDGKPPRNVAHTFIQLELALKNDKAEV